VGFGEAVSNILKFNPEAKFIVMLRNPIDMAYSIHSQHLFGMQEDVVDFKTAWSLQELRKKGESIPRFCKEPKLLQYGEVCKLGEQMQRLYRAVSKENVFVIMFDDFKNDTKKVYEDVLKFLNVPSDNRENFPIINENKRVKINLLHSTFNLLRWMKKSLGIYRSLGIIKLFNNLIWENVKRNPLSYDFRKKLQNYFHSDIILLQDILQNKTPPHLCSRNRDLSHWLEQ